MTETEGVIKYKLDHHNIAIGKTISIAEINAWRTLLYKLKLIGQIKERYDGYGFGNISQRVNQPAPHATQFIISGTQTGGIETLSQQHYCQVMKADPLKNTISSVGSIKPSSEALTHASVFQQDSSIQAVVHIHSPEIWKHTQRLQIAHTQANIAYGTPEMAIAVKKLMQTSQLKSEKIFTMLGHKDGVIAFADNLEKATLLLVKYYTKAIKIEQGIE